MVEKFEAQAVSPKVEAKVLKNEERQQQLKEALEKAKLLKQKSTK